MSEREELIQGILQAVLEHPEKLSLLLDWMQENPPEEESSQNA